MYSPNNISLCFFFLGFWGFPGGAISQESACKAGDLSSIPGLGRFPGGGHSKYSCLGNAMDRGTWQAAVHGVLRHARSWTKHICT